MHGGLVHVLSVPVAVRKIGDCKYLGDFKGGRFNAGGLTETASNQIEAPFTELPPTWRLPTVPGVPGLSQGAVSCICQPRGGPGWNGRRAHGKAAAGRAAVCRMLVVILVTHNAPASARAWPSSPFTRWESFGFVTGYVSVFNIKSVRRAEVRAYAGQMNESRGSYLLILPPRFSGLHPL